MKANKLSMEAMMNALTNPQPVFMALVKNQSLIDFKKSRVNEMLAELSDSFQEEARPVFEACINDGIQNALVVMVERMPMSSYSERLFESNGLRNFIEMSAAMLKQHNTDKRD